MDIDELLRLLNAPDIATHVSRLEKTKLEPENFEEFSRVLRSFFDAKGREYARFELHGTEEKERVWKAYDGTDSHIMTFESLHFNPETDENYASFFFWFEEDQMTPWPIRPHYVTRYHYDGERVFYISFFVPGSLLGYIEDEGKYEQLFVKLNQENAPGV
jgi:hypothetical protein